MRAVKVHARAVSIYGKFSYIEFWTKQTEASKFFEKSFPEQGFFPSSIRSYITLVSNQSSPYMQASLFTNDFE